MIKMKLNKFEVDYVPIVTNQPDLGKVAILPWDTEIFEFPVGEYRLGGQLPDSRLMDDFKEHLLRWVEKEEAALLFCSSPQQKNDVKLFLQDIGFNFVDLSMQVVQPRLQNSELPPMRSMKVAKANIHEHKAIEEIASTAFQHGRYHADPLFPQQLANLRYKRWVQNVFQEQSEHVHLFVIEMKERIQGFFHVVIKDNRADLRLGAVAKNDEAGLLGYYLYLGVLHELKKMGIRNVVGRISAANISVINIYARLGFHFANPEIAYHWHTPLSRMKR